MTNRFHPVALAIVLFHSVFLLNGQILDPVKWTAKVEQGKSGEATLIATATIDAGWHLYSQKPTDGPIPTAFAWPGCNTFTLLGKTSEPAGKEDHMWAEQDVPGVICFENTAVFRQKIKLKT